MYSHDADMSYMYVGGALIAACTCCTSDIHVHMQLLQVYMYMLVELVEHLPSTQNVAGSNPTRGSSFFLSRKKGVVFGRSCLLCLVSLNEFTCTSISKP